MPLKSYRVEMTVRIVTRVAAESEQEAFKVAEEWWWEGFDGEPTDIIDHTVTEISEESN